MADPKPPRAGAEVIADRILAAEERTRTFASASGTQRNRVLADLAGRLSYFTRDPDAFQLWERTEGGDDQTFLTEIAFGPILEFTLREQRLVRVVTTVGLATSFTSYDANRSGSAGIQSTSIVDGVFGAYADETDSVWSDVPLGPPVIRIDSSTKRGRVEQYLDLQAGTHTVQVGISPVQVNPYGSGAAWNARITADAPAIAVDVLQPID